MRYTEHGLQIPLDELRRMLEYAENRAKHDNMESCVYITPGSRPRNICSEVNHANYS